MSPIAFLIVWFIGFISPFIAVALWRRFEKPVETEDRTIERCETCKLPV